MKNRIEQEIDKTLGCMGDGFDIHVSPLFVETLNGRIARTQIGRSVGYRSRAFYPVALLLMVVLNSCVLWASFGEQGQVVDDASYQASVIADEYGIGQSNTVSF